MSPDERDELLLEAATCAWRERDADGLPLPAPAWADLDDAGRRECLRRQLAARALERAIDPRGWSSTVHAVVERLR